ncbi:MAG: T9SS type A sorting domain-containing protein [Bacteroidetes bacterium]|nr:T9SS type A sorting domain-containing protein [Bacteroidota bacterium]
MKKITTLYVAILAGSISSFAQNQEEKIDVKITHDQCTGFMKTQPLKDLLKNATIIEEGYYDNWKPKDRDFKPDYSAISDIGIPENQGIDPALQSTNGTRDGQGWLKANWQAQSGAFPPDPTGAAGPDYFVQAVNSTYRVYNKDGSAATSPASLATLWPGSSADGDPIVMYDRFADRWFISQFQTGSNEILIAISETADPLGSYFLYTFAFTAFPDYPKFGVWSNAYFMTCNTSANDCIAFEREKMLLGDPTASKINMSFPSFYQFFNSVAPAYAEGPTEPDADEPGYFFAVQDNSWSGISTDHIKVLKATINWTSPGSSSVVSHQTLNTTAFNSVFTNTWDDISQQGTTQKLDAVTGIFMYRAQYRRFTDYNVVMLCHTVDVDNTNRAGVRWYELRENNDAVWYIYQQGTYSPDSQNSRWMGNVAMDQQGNIALAYSFCGPSDYAGIRYTGRFKDDPLGEMTVQEQIGVDGAGAQTTGNRYGDYSQMTMDPSDDMTFWFTGEYLGPSGSRRTRIMSFSSWNLAGEEEIQEAIPFFNAYQPSPDVVRVIWNGIKDQTVNATIVDMNGKLVANTQINTQNTQEDFDVSTVASGIYFISLKGEQTNLSQKIYLAR